MTSVGGKELLLFLRIRNLHGGGVSSSLDIHATIRMCVFFYMGMRKRMAGFSSDIGLLFITLWARAMHVWRNQMLFFAELFFSKKSYKL